MRTLRSLTAWALALPLWIHAQSGPVIWNIKAVLPNGTTLDVNAFDRSGRVLDVKALEDDDTHVMDVKAMDNGALLPVKVISGDEAMRPVKAIAADGALLDVKAVGPDGRRLDVKGVARAGHLVHIKAIGDDRALYAVKAISADGRMRDVKGLDLSDDVERTNGVAIEAHVKALPHPTDHDGDPLWNVKCVQPDGHLLGIKAIDAAGALHDIKALQANGDATVLDIRALVNGREVPVKVLATQEAPMPVKAVLPDGTLLDVKAVAADGTRLPVKAVRRLGNVFDIKALAADGREMGVKAISPHGLFYDVKGVKLNTADVEGTVNGVAFRAHVKALPQP